MNSSIITEQKNGKGTEDILAGICRSIVENVFTKVVRVASLDALGETIVVQGGTFKNDAVLRAFEQYTGRTVIRPDLPGEMGAIGIALLTKRHVAEHGDEYRSRFIGLDALESFSYEKRPGVECSFCTNSCSRTVITFGDGTHFVTGNRCERGQIIGASDDKDVRRQVAEATRAMRAVPDLVRSHNRILTEECGIEPVRKRQGVRIGLPRALEMWDSLPFWRALFTALGYDVVVSKRSTYDLFDQALPSVPSDTICFPAKLVHGHVRDLINKGVDRIFMPMMIHMPKENATAEACHVCSVVQGYPLVVAQADEPERRYGVKLSKPMFYWQNRGLKREQVIAYCVNELGASNREAGRALRHAESARATMLDRLRDEAVQVLASLEGTNDFAVVLAGRPYHSDELVNHHLASYFTRLGIPVITLNAVEALSREDLAPVRMETTIPFHARMMSAALFTARHPNLELVQIVSFGCGHDAIISDEMIRLLHETSDKEMLVLKLDEGEAQGPLSIRVNSFVETVRQRRRRFGVPQVQRPSIRDGFPVKFLRRDKRERVVLVPTLSPAFSTLIARVVEMEGYRCLTLPPADAEAIALGKQYVHNDICFPAQVNIGEALSFLRGGHIDSDHVAVGLAKNCEDCRAGQYAALARKALDQAGYPNVPIITTGVDRKGMHPGFSLSPLFEIRMIWGLSMVDGLESMRRSVRPYELRAGESDGVFQRFVGRIVNELERGAGAALSVFSEAVDAFNQIRVDRTKRKPRVGVVGEILLNYHPSANCRIEEYLERNGMEVVLPNLIDFFRRGFVALREKALRRVIPHAFFHRVTTGVADFFFNKAASLVEEHLRRFAFWEPRHTIEELTDNIRDLVDPSYEVGEGWLMPAEMTQLLKRGINSVVIVQPFGCLPNHITGRGLVKPIKERFPHAQILSLDYDPDTSLANIENRLQMLIITARELEKRRGAGEASTHHDAATAVQYGGGGS
jgi:predicted nucleotide-binding protein (sugar kinase/HSP70/actin superfamily)